MRTYATGAALFALTVMTGCATGPKTLYYWGDYQNQVHDYLQATDGGDTQKQVAALEAGIEQAKAGDQALPPGYRAQLGMLYYGQGKPDQAFEQLQLERLTFPESAAYIDRLLAKFKKT